MRVVFPANVLFVALVFALFVNAAVAGERISHGRFEGVTLYRPAAAARAFVLFVSGNEGWDRKATEMARVLVDQGAMVAGIDFPRLNATVKKDDDECIYLGGDFENLAHYLQAYAGLPTYFTPLLAGDGAGASLAYAVLAQAPGGTFAGALSMAFCPELALAKPPCEGQALHYVRHPDGRAVNLLPAGPPGLPWVAMHGTRERRCDTESIKAFVDAIPRSRLQLFTETGDDSADTASARSALLAGWHQLAPATSATQPAPPRSLDGLPLIEVSTERDGDTFAVFLSGDGGWAGLDKDVAAALAAQGIPVVGLDSLRYFWAARTPQGVADDLARIVDYYAAHWRRSRAVLIGYSQGADVLPFAINRLPAGARERVTLAVLIAIGERATFEFHLDQWLRSDSGGLPVRPEVDKLAARTTLCLYGEEDGDALCPRISAAHVRAQALAGGHHFDGDFDALAGLIVRRIRAHD